jgi:hypothetical protein
MNFSTGGSESMELTSGGNLGINTGNPGTKLSVDGLSGTTSYNYLRYDTSTGDFYYYSSSKRYKNDIQTWNQDPYQILQAEPRSFIDQASGERNIGYIAEEFEKAGLEELVIYDEKGRPNGLEYQLVPMYNLEIIKDHQKNIQQIQAELGMNQAGDTYLQNGGDANLASLNVSGETKLNNLTVTDATRLEGPLIVNGQAEFNGKLTVQKIQVEADITVGGRLVSEGDQPDITVGQALEQEAEAIQDTGEENRPQPAEVEIEGTDTAGTITIQTGEADVIETGAAAEVTFHSKTEETPRVSLTPANEPAARASVYVKKTAEGFTVMSAEALTTDTQYRFDYLTIGSRGEDR